VAGIPWGKYDRSDWQRVPKGAPGYSATARTYRLTQHPSVIISRRQYDEHYGHAAAAGTYERKARANKGPAQLGKPARGRSSIKALSPAEQEVELGRRKIAQTERQTAKLSQRQLGKQVRIPKSITLRNFPRGHAIRSFRTGVNHDQIESIRLAAARSRLVFGYWVGLELVSERTGGIVTPSLFSQRDIQMAFTNEDFENALRTYANRYANYAQLTGMFISLHLTRAAAERNGVVLRKR
jgi:hypothetical protein